MPEVVTFEQLRRLALEDAARRAAADRAPTVVWSLIGETEAFLADRLARIRERAGGGRVLAIVPAGVATPEGILPVAIPEKCFNTLHPLRRKRFTVLKGGRGAAKSWSIARVLVAESLASPLSILCCREIQSSIRASVHKLLANTIRSLGLQRWFNIDVRAITAHNGSEFSFEGLFSNVDKVKSYEGAQVCWVEEAESISAESWQVLEPTIRAPGSFFVVNYNPDLTDAPTHEMFAVAPRPDAVVEHVTLADNPFATEPLCAAAAYMRSVDDDAYRHVWLGECRSHSDAQILKGKVVTDDFESQPQWAGPYLGLDFGFSQDPTAAVRCYVHERTLFVERECWAVGCDIDKTPALLDQLGTDARQHAIRADSSRPESISYLRQHGFPHMTAVVKWPGSVEDGVAHLRQYERIVIHPRCEHVIEEARLYSYKTDKLTNAVLPEIVGKFDHTIDALRYALLPLIRAQPGQNVFDFVRQQVEAHRVAQAAKANEPTPPPATSPSTPSAAEIERRRAFEQRHGFGVGRGILRTDL